MTPRAKKTGQQGKDRSPGGKRGRRETAKPSPVTWLTARCEATAVGWRFTLPALTSANTLWRSAHGRTYKASTAKADVREAQKRFGRAGQLRGDVAVRIEWVRARKAGDLDNKAKATLDLLKGIAYGDDAAVVELHMHRTDDPTRAPGLYVDVWTLTQQEAA